MLNFILFTILFSYSLLVYKKINSKNSFHLRYLLFSLIFNFFTIAFYVLNTEFKIKALVYVLLIMHQLSILFFYLHIDALLLGRKKKINFIHYAFLLLLFLFGILDVFKIHFLFTSNTNLLNPVFTNIFSTPNFSDLFGIKQMVLICYLFLTLRTIHQNINTASLIKNKKSYKRWIYLYLLVALLFVFFTITRFYNPLNFDASNSETIFAIFKVLFVLLTLNYYLNPILLGTILKVKKIPITKTSQNDFQRLNSFFLAEKRYLNPKTSLESVSNDVGLTKTQIRNCILLERHQNFNQFVNYYRVDFAATLLENGSYLQNHTVESVALKCGFNSPQSFYQNFKKIKKVTPSMYVKKQHKRAAK